MKFNYYQIINNVNGKVYIGITEKTLEQRKIEHLKLLKKDKHFNYKLQNDWNIYGEKNFSFVLLDTLSDISLEEGYNYEYELISSYTGEKYNLAPGGKINPMYSEEIRNKMKRTKTLQAKNILQLEEIEENVFKVIAKYNSQKEAGRLSSADQGNINNAIKKHTKGCGYYWIIEMTKEEFENTWKPSRTKITPCAQLNECGEIVKVHHNRSIFEKEYNWTAGCIKGAIKRNGRTHNIKFIDISEEDYYKLCPVTLLF